MAKITEYPEAQSFDAGDVILKDGTNGTKKMTAETLKSLIAPVDSTLSQTGKAADAKAVGDAAKALEKTINGIGDVALSGEEVNLSQYASTGAFISTSSGKWITGSGDECWIAPIYEDNKFVSVTANSSKSAMVAMLTTNSHTAGTDPDYVTGESMVVIEAGATKLVEIPSGCQYCYIAKANGGTNYAPVSFKYETPAVPPVDTTLSHSGEAADAKTVGDLFGGVPAQIGTKIINEWVYSQYITTSGETGSVVDIEHPAVSSTAFRFAIVDCSPGDLFTISGKGSISARLFCFIDNENKIVWTSGTNAISDNHVVIAPDNSAKIIIQQAVDFQEDCFKGVSPYATEKMNNPRSYSRDANPGWEKGGVDSTGYITASTNIRTRGIYINKGETLVVTNTANRYDIAVFGYLRDGSYAMLTDNYQGGVGQIVASDERRAYYVRYKKHDGSNISVSDGDKVEIKILNNKYTDTDGWKERALENVGFNRSYVYLNPFLTFERKDLESDGTLSTSTTRCIAKLPKNGCVEVRQKMFSGCFKIAKVSNGTVTYLVNDWSYYTYRYVGDNTSDYYLIVAMSNNLESEITEDGAAMRISVYSFEDEGIRSKKKWILSNKKIAFIGDSIVQGLFDKFSNGSLNKLASKPVGELVAEEIGDDNYGNFGIGGAYVYNSDWKSLYANCTKVTGYDVVFVFAGTNDYGNNVSQSNFTDAYTYVIETLMTNNTEVVVCTPIYRTSKTGNNTQGMNLYDYAAIEISIAQTKEIKAIDLYKFTNKRGFMTYVPDGLHPNERGHKIIADHILNEYQRLST